MAAYQCRQCGRFYGNRAAHVKTRYHKIHSRKR